MDPRDVINKDTTVGDLKKGAVKTVARFARKHPGWAALGAGTIALDLAARRKKKKEARIASAMKREWASKRGFK